MINNTKTSAHKARKANHSCTVCGLKLWCGQWNNSIWVVLEVACLVCGSRLINDSRRDSNSANNTVDQRWSYSRSRSSMFSQSSWAFYVKFTRTYGWTRQPQNLNQTIPKNMWDYTNGERYTQRCLPGLCLCWWWGSGGVCIVDILLLGIGTGNFPWW